MPALCEPGSLALCAHCVECCSVCRCLCVSWIAEFAKEKEAIALSISQQMVRRIQNGMRHAYRYRGGHQEYDQAVGCSQWPLSALPFFFSACLLLHVD